MELLKEVDMTKFFAAILLFFVAWPSFAADPNGYIAQYECRAGNPNCDVDVVGLTDNTDPVKIEKDLTTVFPKSAWGKMNYLLISHGRAVCTARNPACERCAIKGYCKYFRKQNS